jgi:pimeloyl-ACP methyl ester carboxylesterase
MTRYYSRFLAIAVIALTPALSLGTGGAPKPTVLLQQPASAFKAPDNIDFRSKNIMSEGVRLHAELFSLKSLAGKQLPTVIMAHGWGGTAAGFRRDAIDLANAGYLVIDFDYRGWGESDSRVILTGPEPAKKDGLKFTAEVQEVREVVDPLEMVIDWFNAIHWAMASRWSTRTASD